MARPTLHVLSPHPDDAALSLAMTLARAARAGWAIQLTTCFSRSGWAPGLSQRDVGEVTAVRRDEDRRYAAALGPACRRVDLGGTDAPWREGYEQAFAFIHRRPYDRREREMKAWLEGRLREEVGPGAVLAPLGLGAHVDHRLVRDATLAVLGRRAIGLYEELPYALGEPAARADALAARLPLPLAPLLVPAGPHRPDKLKAVCLYRSQATSAHAAQTLLHARARGGGERLLVTEAMRRLLVELIGGRAPA